MHATELEADKGQYLTDRTLILDQRRTLLLCSISSILPKVFRLAAGLLYWASAELMVQDVIQISYHRRVNLRVDGVTVCLLAVPMTRRL